MSAMEKLSAAIAALASHNNTENAENAAAAFHEVEGLVLRLLANNADLQIHAATAVDVAKRSLFTSGQVRLGNGLTISAEPKPPNSVADGTVTIRWDHRAQPEHYEGDKAAVILKIARCDAPDPLGLCEDLAEALTKMAACVRRVRRHEEQKRLAYIDL